MNVGFTAVTAQFKIILRQASPYLRTAALAIAIVALPRGQAVPQERTGKYFYENCREAGSSTACALFIQGFGVGFNAAELAYGLEPEIYCSPDEVGAEQKLAVLLHYLEANHQIRHYDIAALALRAFRAAWPC